MMSSKTRTSLELIHYSLFALIVGAIFPSLTVVLKEYVFVPFIVATAGMLSFMFLYLPETKNRPVNTTASLFEGSQSYLGLKASVIQKGDVRSVE